MEYIYSALLLHSAGQKITEESVKNVLNAAGAKSDETRIKAMISALEGVDIDEVIKQTAIPVAAPVAEEKEEEEGKKKEEKKEEEGATAEEAAAGLASLFG